MTNEQFAEQLARVKSSGGIMARVANDVWPKGATLQCYRCGHRTNATTEQCARYLSTGWPTHCGATMTANNADA